MYILQMLGRWTRLAGERTRVSGGRNSGAIHRDEALYMDYSEAIQEKDMESRARKTELRRILEQS
jgi:hypothetical protein